MSTADVWDEVESAPSQGPRWLLGVGSVLMLGLWVFVALPPLDAVWSPVRLVISGAAAAGVRVAYLVCARRPLRTFWSAWVALLALVSGSATLMVGEQLRVAHANSLAVKYHLVDSTSSATTTQRCAAHMLSDWEHTSRAKQLALPRRTLTWLAPKACALGISQKLVSKDGLMSTQSGEELASQVVQQVGSVRVLTMIGNDLAVIYGFAASMNSATRSDRCNGFLLSFYDREPTVGMSRPRALMQVRSVCARGSRLGLVPPSGRMTDGTITRIIGGA